MMESRELDRRRGWPWKNRKSGLSSGGSEGGSSPSSVKLFDEQEVARILQDQVRIGDEQLQEADLKHAEKEKVLNEKLAVALAEITIKDNLVKQHIKVAEEAVGGWEKAENEAAEFKAELENAAKQQRASEDRAKHLDGALQEIMQQLRGGRQMHEKHLHDTIVKKTREFDKMRLELEAKLSDMAKSLSNTRTQLIESQAENEGLNHALKDRSRMIAELNDMRAHAETDRKILRVRLDGHEKESFDLKYRIHSVTKELEIRSAELEYGKKTSEVLSRHHADSVKKIARLEDERNRLRVMVRKKLPNPAAIVRMKQELDALGKEAAGDSARGRRRSLNRSQSGGVDFLPVHELEDFRESDHALRIANMDGETHMLKEALAKRNDELLQARIMCSNTASRLSTVENELETLRSAASAEVLHNQGASSSACSTSSTPVLERASSKDSLQKFVDMERVVHSASKSESRLGFEGPHETATAELESGLAEKTRDLEVANQMCEELKVKLIAAEVQLAAMGSRNSANEQSVNTLQERLEKLLEIREEADEQIPEAEVYVPEAPEITVELQLELATALKRLFQTTEALARALDLESSPEDDATSGPVAKAFHWKDLHLESSMSSLVQVANKLLEGQVQPASFVSELSSTLACITGLSSLVTKDHEDVCVHRESSKAQISQLEEALCKLQEERAEVEIQLKNEVDRVLKETERVQREKTEIMHHLSGVEPELHEAYERVDSLKDQVNEAENLAAELRLQLDQQKQEDELLEEELLELSSSHKNMRVAEAEMSELHAKLAALENELHGERRRHHDVVAKLEDLQEQIHRGVGRNADALVHNNEFSLPFIGEDVAIKSARQEREISSAAVAECQRTILALGKQLKVLGFSPPPTLDDAAPSDSPDSIQRMTETMELLRWRTESGDQGSLLPSGVRDYSRWGEAVTSPPAPGPNTPEGSTGDYYQATGGAAAVHVSLPVAAADGPVSVPASPGRSDWEAPSTPESPAVVRSMRTVRSFQLPKTPDGEGTNAEPGGCLVRSLSQTSVSPAHAGRANGNSS